MPGIGQLLSLVSFSPLPPLPPSILGISREPFLPKSSQRRISQQFSRDEEIISGLANPVWAGRRKWGGSSGDPTVSWAHCGEGEVTVKPLCFSLLLLWKRRGGKAAVTGDALNRIYPSKPALALSTNHIQFPAPQWLY